jgi:protein-disulfide isomerase
MRAAILMLLLAGLTAAGCDSQPPAGAETTSTSGSTPVAVVGGQTVTLAELDTWIKDQLLDEQLSGKSDAAQHEFREEHLDGLIEEKLVADEAERRGITPDALREEFQGSAEVSDAQVEDFFTKNKERLGNRELEQMDDRIRSHLEAQEARRAETTQLAELRRSAGVELLMDAPRLVVAAVGPSIGPEDAPITIIEFSDFECPFCGRASPTVKQVLAEYEGKVRLVYRHFPLESIHPNARGAAGASACANEQGKFWEYHDVLFANSRQLSPEKFEVFATQAGLDATAFNACVADGRFDADVDRDLADARSVGVSGTPSFFINGRMLGGAQPFDAFKRIIDAELANTEAAS